MQYSVTDHVMYTVMSIVLVFAFALITYVLGFIFVAATTKIKWIYNYQYWWFKDRTTLVGFLITDNQMSTINVLSPRQFMINQWNIDSTGHGNMRIYPTIPTDIDLTNVRVFNAIAKGKMVVSDDVIGCTQLWVGDEVKDIDAVKQLHSAQLLNPKVTFAFFFVTIAILAHICYETVSRL